MIRAAAALMLASVVLVVPGCYKSQYESEKTRAEDAEKKSKDVQAQLDQARSDLAAAQTRAQQLEAQWTAARTGSTLVSFVDGKPAGRETIRFDGTQWVRHGDCARAGGVVKFENGRLADQTLLINQPGGKPWYTGAVKFGKPDGEWIWFDADGKPSMRETWAGGKLVEVAKASTAKGPLAWNKVTGKDRDAWVKTSGAALGDLPELSRDTSAPVVAASPSGAGAGGSGTGAKVAPGATKKPAGK